MNRRKDGMPNEQATKRMKIAALVYGSGTDPSPALSEAVRQLRTRGVVLAGAVQHSDGPCSMELEILPSGTRVPISQSLGAGSNGCRLDSAALAEAASMVRRALAGSPQLVVFNKFGAQEAAGSGMYAEMAEAAMAGMPLLTAVNEQLLPQWSAFTGGEFTRLPCTAAAAAEWWAALAGPN